MLIAGLLEDTPLGNVVKIRSEKDPSVIKDFGPSAKKIYNDWKNKRVREAEVDKEQLDKMFKQLDLTLKRAFG